MKTTINLKKLQPELLAMLKGVVGKAMYTDGYAQTQNSKLYDMLCEFVPDIVELEITKYDNQDDLYLKTTANTSTHIRVIK